MIRLVLGLCGFLLMLPFCLVHPGIFVILLSFHKKALVLGSHDVAIVLVVGSVDIIYRLVTHLHGSCCYEALQTVVIVFRRFRSVTAMQHHAKVVCVSEATPLLAAIKKPLRCRFPLKQQCFKMLHVSMLRMLRTCVQSFPKNVQSIGTRFLCRTDSTRSKIVRSY